MLGLSGIPGCIHFIGFYFLPESPRWLLGQQREEEARVALCVIRRKTDVDRELADIYMSLQTKKEEQSYS